MMSLIQKVSMDIKIMNISISTSFQNTKIVFDGARMVSDPKSSKCYHIHEF